MFPFSEANSQFPKIKITDHSIHIAVEISQEMILWLFIWIFDYISVIHWRFEHMHSPQVVRFFFLLSLHGVLNSKVIGDNKVPNYNPKCSKIFLYSITSKIQHHWDQNYAEIFEIPDFRGKIKVITRNIKNRSTFLMVPLATN